jgi:hypothetical protein
LFGEVPLAVGPVVNLVEELFEGLAGVIAGEGFVHVPPDPLDRVGFRRVLEQVVEHDPAAPAGQVLLRLLAIVKPSVVAHDVNYAIAAQTVTEVVQMGHEQVGVPPRSRRDRISRPVRQWSDPARWRFSLFPGVTTSACSPRGIHWQPILGLRWMSTSS